MLKGVELLVDRKAGGQPEVFYRLAAPCALDFFACLELILEAQA